MNSNQAERKNRFSLTLLFGFIVFVILLAALLMAGITIYMFTSFNIISYNGGKPGLIALLLIMSGISLFLGFITAVLAAKIPLKPLNRLISYINALAAGKYDTRLEYGEKMNMFPAFAELSESCNKLAEELENTEMLRSDFINNFSHEFKTPIVSIAGFAKLLNKGNLSEQQQKEYLQIIENESMRLSYMATNVLNLTKVENQTILTDISNYNLSEQLRSAVLLLESKWSKKNIDIDVELDEHYISANEELMQQVWINLLDNAVKFTPNNGFIGIKAVRNEASISVSIINSGSYISRENIKKIFNKFYQVDESHSTTGNGVGLAIVKRVVDLHKGTVDVLSNNSVTEFKVNMPV